MSTFSYRFIVNEDSARCHVNFISDKYSCPICVIWYKDKKFGFRRCTKLLSDSDLNRFTNLIHPVLLHLIFD